jgi:hypothetical protein
MSGSIKTFDGLPQATPGSAPYRPVGGTQGRGLPLVGLIRNPRSHRNGGREPEYSAQAEVLSETTHKRRDLYEVLDRYAQAGIDYLAISGGDGTVRDVLTCGAAIFGDHWPTLIVVPKGKTNALASDLGLPGDWTLARAIERAEAGSHVVRRPLVVSEVGDPAARVQGFMLGAGVFTRSISLGQTAHRIGAFNAIAVLVTALWTLYQAFFAGGSNAWRQPTGIRLEDDAGAPIAGDETHRYFLIGSTLENFPMGLKPFGTWRQGLKLAMLDRPRRKSLLRVPLIALGRLPSDPERLGYHWLAPESFRLTVEDRFILDGEAFPPGAYRVSKGPQLRFAVP